MASHYPHSPERPLVEPAGASIRVETALHAERQYAVGETAEMWNLSADKVCELFENESGVLVIGERSPRHKRRYVTLSNSSVCARTGRRGLIAR